MNVLRIPDYEEEVTDHKGYAARREPFNSLRHKKDITKPAEEKSKDYSGKDILRREAIKTEQCEQDERLRDIPQTAVLLQGRIKMDGGGYNENSQKNVLHWFISDQNLFQGEENYVSFFSVLNSPSPMARSIGREKAMPCASLASPAESYIERRTLSLIS